MSDKKDLTRIEDLSEFIHQEDPDLDEAFSEQDEEESTSDELAEIEEDDLSSLDELENEGTQDNIGVDAASDWDNEKTSLHELDEDEFAAPAEEFQQDEDAFSEPAESEEEFSFENNEWETSEESGPEETASFDIGEDFELSEESELKDQESPPAFEATEELEEPFLAQEEESAPADEEQEEFEDAPLIEEEEVPVAPPPPVQEPVTHRPPPVRFDDLKQFGESITYGKITSGGHPPYSVILKNIKFEEDVDDIADLLSELGLMNTSNESAYREALNNGALLVSQLSEFSAIYLTHRLRRFDLDLMMGLSEELHPSKSYDGKDVGLVRKEGIRQNKAESLSLIEAPQSLDAILISTTPTLEGYRIHRYLGVVSAHQVVLEMELAPPMTDEEGGEEDPEMQLLTGQTVTYAELVQELKVEAFKLKANAVVGITFQLTPLVEADRTTGETRFKITCTGNAVWLSALGG